MKLLAKIDYACKAVLELTLRYKGEAPLQLNKISEAQGIPKNFLIQLMLRLKNADIVRSTRGIAGGYYLARPPSEITLADVFRAVDDSIIDAPGEKKSGHASDSTKLILNIWQEVNKETARRLREITFEQLIAKLKSSQLTYYI